MEYTIQQLSKLAGVSSRTLRHYHQIGLLNPSRKNSAGYRIYGTAEVDLLQQILFYRRLGMELSAIKQLLTDTAFNSKSALAEHLAGLKAQKQELELLITTVEKTILKEKGELKMTDKEKFEGLKRELIKENEEKYGDETREKYGKAKVEESNRKFMNLTEEQYAEMEELTEQIRRELKAAVTNGANPTGPEGMRLAQLHKRWLGFTWKEYSPEAHVGLGEMYVADPRFTAYYDSEVPGCAAFLKEAIAACSNSGKLL